MEKNFVRDKGFKRFINSFKYSLSGIKYAFKTEINIKIMLIIGLIAITLGIILKISITRLIIVIFLTGVILSLEMINTSIENTIDLITEKYNPKAKIAKDCASASLTILSLIAIIIGIIIFIEPIIKLIGGLYD